MRKATGALSLASMLCGCSWLGIFQADSLHWYKPGATYKEYLDVRRVCILEAREMVSPRGTVTTDNSLTQKGEAIRSSDFIPCMKSRGYVVDPNGFGPPGDTVFVDPNN